MKKWYIASRMRHKDSISQIISILEKHNQKVTFNWTKLQLKKPYNEYEKEYSDIAESICSAVMNTDIFILISDKEGTDMFIELGMILVKQKQDPNIKIYCVGKYNSRSLMHLHPVILKMNSLEEVFEEELPKCVEEIKKIKLEI